MRVLIVDDSSIVRKALRKELADTNYDLEEADDPLAALERIRSEHFDLITLDVDMPGCTGYELCERIRAEKDSRISNTAIVFVTGRDTLDGRLKGFEAGATNFITKSFHKGELCDIVKGLLEPEKRFQGHTILLVDDSTIVLRSLERALGKYGAALLTAQSGAEAYAIAKERLNELSMVITDYSMPEMNGDELCKKLRFDLGMKQTPIIFLSAQGGKERKLEMFRAGATDYLEKPFIREELLARVEVQLIQMQHNQRIETLNSELVQANDSLKSFVSIASHDLRSPVGNIHSITGSLLEEWEDETEEGKLEFLQMAHESADSALSLLNGLLRFSTSSAKSLEVESLSLEDLAKGAIADLRFKISESGAKVNLDPLPTVSGDGSLLQQVFQNLLGNALKYQEKGNTPEVNIWCIAEDEQAVTICFEDNGIGFQPELAEKLFKPFTRGVSKAAYDGSGIGLGTVSNIIKRHGGKVWADSELGKGARFYVLLPKVVEGLSA